MPADPTGEWTVKTRTQHRLVASLVGGLIVLPILAGCASFSHDAGLNVVNDTVAPELRHDAVKVDTAEAAAEAKEKVRRLLGGTLSADAAVRIALLNNKGLQAAYNALGLAEATMVEASLPPTPSFSLSRIATPVELDIERRIVADILALASLPIRAEIAAGRFRQAQLRAAEETLRLAAEARRAYYQAVASQQLIAFLEQSLSTADAAARLARQLGETGAMNKLDQARQDAFYADVVTQRASARQNATAARERLIRAMGLWGGDLAFRLQRALPTIPARPRSLLTVETDAIRRRVDLQIARLELEAVAKSYGLTNATRFINLLEVSGVSRTQRESGGAAGTGGGIEVQFQIPIFDFGEVRMRQASETYMQAVNRLTEKAVNVRSEARQAYQAYRSSYDIARHYRNDVLPLRKIISDETMLRYGAMQIDVFSLLAEARQRIAANIGAIGAQKDFWLATTDLEAAVVGGGMAEVTGGSSPTSSATPANE